ncbi:GntR family transcriptional regulator [Zophobihabitans entericus]|uniref:GntR family transcriptional regulator n=1 Tax=Zophobihabitans entericus TaxID=1635327 RepID=A0A6G9IBD8_9GAMM|nr:GntR family transcriptional regulator [Zophobihabitans entericus]QIQ21147.1 GntR family transcriptional regulator [Zophobihabitans entericus]
MNSNEEIYQELKNRIIQNEITGAISESDLCAKFNISRTPLREAIFRLINEGWIDYTKNKTKVVKPITLKELIDIFQIRADIEIMLLTLSWHNINTAIYQQIKHNIQIGLKTKDINLLMSSDNQLHHQLLEDCRNELVIRMLSFIYDRLRMLRAENPQDNAIFYSSEEHLAICDAILERDLDKTKQAIENHVNNSKKRLLSTLS